jgi:hypothetical protein
MPVTLPDFDGVADAIRRVAGDLAYVRVETRPDGEPPDPVVTIHLDPTDPLVRPQITSPNPQPDHLVEALVAALREELEHFVADTGPVALRVRMYRHKGEYLTSRTLHSAGRRPMLGAAAAPELSFRAETVDDLLVQRLIAITHNVQLHNEQMGGNYQRLFDVAERILVRAAGLNETRAVRAEAHVLDLWDKRIAEKRAAHEIVDKERQEQGDVTVKVKAVEEASGVLKQLVNNVAAALGIDVGAAGKLGGLVDMLNDDPELKEAIADPATLAALKNPDVRGVVKGMLRNLKTGTLGPEDEAAAPPQPEA